MTYRLLKTRLTIGLLFLILALLYYAGMAFEIRAQMLHTLLEEVTVEASRQTATILPPEGLPPAIRLRPVHFLPTLTAPEETFRVGDQLLLNLFEDRHYLARIDHIETNILGITTLRGRLEGYAWGHVLMSVENGRCLVSIRIPELNQSYVIQFDRTSGAHYLLEIDEEKIPLPPPRDSLIPPLDASSYFESPLPKRQSLTNVSGKTVIDILIAYTPAARRFAEEHHGGIGHLISQMTAYGQQVLDDSHIQILLNLVQAAEIFGYRGEDSDNVELNKLQNPNDGNMDEVHAWRDRYGADLVVLLNAIEGGIAFLLMNPSGSPDYGFSKTGMSLNLEWMKTAFIHEIGHNLGCHHSKFQRSFPGPGIFSYSAGWHFTGVSGSLYATIMAYTTDGYGNSYTRIPIFSSPLLTYDGVVAGDAQHGDNVRTIHNTKHVVAAYRPPRAAPLAAQPLHQAGFEGIAGVGFEPETLTFTLQNRQTETLQWQARANANWLALQPTQGTLGPQETTTVRVSLTAEALKLPPQQHEGQIIFSNRLTGQTLPRIITLDIEAAEYPLCQALDNCDLTWTTGGHQPWFGQTDHSQDNVDAAQSGPIGHRQQSWLETEVVGPGELSFWWRVSSERDFDVLAFAISGQEQDRISGTPGWQKKVYAIPAGDQVLRWNYVKDQSGSAGLDSGWVDQVNWVSATAGRLTVNIQPAEAVTAGAQWRRTGTSSWRTSGSTEANLPAGAYDVEFKPLDGWESPAAQRVTIQTNQATRAAGRYGIYTTQADAERIFNAAEILYPAWFFPNELPVQRSEEHEYIMNYRHYAERNITLLTYDGIVYYFYGGRYIRWFTVQEWLTWLDSQ